MLQVARLLTKVRAVKKGSAEDKLRKYSLVQTWADRSETVVNVRAMLICELCHSWYTFPMPNDDVNAVFPSCMQHGSIL